GAPSPRVLRLRATAARRRAPDAALAAGPAGEVPRLLLRPDEGGRRLRRPRTRSRGAATALPRRRPRAFRVPPGTDPHGRARSHEPRDRDPRLGRGRQDEPRDRGDPGRLAEHGAQAPGERLREARRAHAYGGRGPRVRVRELSGRARPRPQLTFAG